MTEKCIPDLTPLGYPGGGKTTPARLARRVKRSYRTSLYCAGLFLIGGATCVAGGVALGDLPLHIMGAAMAYTGIVFLATACIGRDQYTLVQMTAREGRCGNDR